VVAGLNNIDGFDCQDAEGAMYCFPKVDIPQKAVEEAEEKVSERALRAANDVSQQPNNTLVVTSSRAANEVSSNTTIR